MSLAGCSLFESSGGEGGESGAVAMSGNAAYDNMLAEVTARQKEAQKTGGAWTTPDDLLDQAAEAAKDKQFDKAMKLLKEADDVIAMSKSQFDSQKNAGPHLF